MWGNPLIIALSRQKCHLSREVKKGRRHFPPSPGTRRDMVVSGWMRRKRPWSWANKFHLVKEHKVCLAHCPCISIPVPSTHCPEGLKADVQLGGRGAGQDSMFGLLMVRSVLHWKEKTSFKLWYHFQRCITSFPSAGATSQLGMRQATRDGILLCLLQCQAFQSCKHTTSPCPSLISGREVYPRPPQQHCSCSRETGSNLPLNSRALSTAGWTSTVLEGIRVGIIDLPG